MQNVSPLPFTRLTEAGGWMRERVRVYERGLILVQVTEIRLLHSGKTGLEL
jgi:hypothetical protein